MGFPAKLFEVMLYLDSYQIDNIDDHLSNRGIKDYAWIIHDKDPGKPHVHVFIRAKDTRNSDHVAKWFGVGGNMVNKVKGRFADALRYLTHQNAPDKYQYSPDEVQSNFAWKKEAQKKTKKEQENAIYDRIVRGDIKEYNLHQHIPHDFYIHYQRGIKLAFDYRRETIRSKGRDMNSIYITGDSGVGKTSLAKMVADQRGFAAFISSGSNDVLDGYRGEECIILDDLRPSSLGLSDLLKMLDPYTASSVKSRYTNKVLECQLIIITTTLPIDEFFKNVFESEKETVVQFKRRCGVHIEVTRDSLYTRMWNKAKNEYLPPVKTFNPIPGISNQKTPTLEEEVEYLSEVTGLAELYKQVKKE